MNASGNHMYSSFIKSCCPPPLDAQKHVSQQLHECPPFLVFLGPLPLFLPPMFCSNVPFPHFLCLSRSRVG